MKTVQEHKNGQCTIFAQTERSSQIHLDDAEVQPKITQKRSGCVMNNVQWKKIRFDGFFDMLPTNTLSRDKLNNQRGEYQNIHYGDVLIKYPYCLDCNNNEIPYINDGVKFNTAEVKDGDVIFADTAEDDTVGKCVEVLNVGDRKIVSGLHTYFCRPRHKLALGYLGYYLNSNHFHNQLLPYIAGSKVSSVNRTSIARTFISYPADLSTQRRIAAILASADKVIAATQNTIAKYKQIKQGMMEELLKPKEGWKMVKLGEVGEIVTGLTYSPSNVCQEGVLVLRSSNIQDDNLCFEDNVYVDVESFNPVIENDILICVRNGSRALIGKTARITKEVEGCAFGAFMMVYRSTYNDFLYHFFKSDMFFSQVSRNIGATINSINGSDLKNMDVYMPSDIIEQHRIASILSGIDAKIAAEEKVLEKYEKVKKGLMERLLDGNLE